MRHPNRLFVAAATGVALLAILTGIALAQGAVSDKLRTGNTVTIAAGETVSHDVYVFAGTVRVEGTIDGDLVASGGLIDVTGPSRVTSSRPAAASTSPGRSAATRGSPAGRCRWAAPSRRISPRSEGGLRSRHQGRSAETSSPVPVN